MRRRRERDLTLRARAPSFHPFDQSVSLDDGPSQKQDESKYQKEKKVQVRHALFYYKAERRPK